MKQQILRSKLSAAERESLFLISAEDDDVVLLDTTILKDYNRAKKRGWELTEEYVYEDGTVVGGKFTAPRRALSIRGVQAKQLSEKQKQNLEKAKKAKEE